MANKNQGSTRRKKTEEEEKRMKEIKKKVWL